MRFRWRALQTPEKNKDRSGSQGRSFSFAKGTTSEYTVTGGVGNGLFAPGRSRLPRADRHLPLALRKVPGKRAEQENMEQGRDLCLSLQLVEKGCRIAGFFLLDVFSRTCAGKKHRNPPIFRKKSVKPARRPEPNCRENPSEAVFLDSLKGETFGLSLFVCRKRFYRPFLLS